MKKRRSTVYVRPGKDVTLYVPVETPPEVIDYLNRLKEEGAFSQGVMEIVTRYVQLQHSGSIPVAAGTEAGIAGFVSPDASTGPQVGNPVSAQRLEPAESTLSAQSLEQPSQADDQAVTHKKFDLTQIFRQAQRNAGKLTDSREKS